MTRKLRSSTGLVNTLQNVHQSPNSRLWDAENLLIHARFDVLLLIAEESVARNADDKVPPPDRT
jgi:hypothetical protein